MHIFNTPLWISYAASTIDKRRRPSTRVEVCSLLFDSLGLIKVTIRIMEESKTPQHTGADSPLEFLSDVDERELARVGKKSVLKVSDILNAARF
jgi:hypothetical protein